MQTQEHYAPTLESGGSEARSIGQSPNSCSTRSRRSRPVSAPVLVRLGAARLDSDAPPPSSADTARRLTHLRHCRPTAAAMFGVYALPHGIVFCQAELGGIGSPIKQPAVPGAALKWYDRL